MNVWDSNHLACERAQLPILRHLIAERSLKLFERLIRASSPCLRDLSYYFKHNSIFKSNIDSLFKDVYDINDVLKNDMDAIIARIYFIQRNEPHSHYVRV